MSAAGLYAYRARVARWIDADTVDLDVDLGFAMSARLRFRLARVDAPGRGQPGHGDALAIASELMPPGVPVIVESYKGDRYGRWIGEVRTLAGANVSDALLASGVARYQP